ncbi:hypothetical protein FB451DRAFT_44132 [Mycena latifolia]|nr:hypothetical protein FB451DRAFT_44132 [Mycena latifolia]
MTLQVESPPQTVTTTETITTTVTVTVEARPTSDVNAALTETWRWMGFPELSGLGGVTLMVLFVCYLGRRRRPVVTTRVPGKAGIPSFIVAFDGGDRREEALDGDEAPDVPVIPRLALPPPGFELDAADPRPATPPTAMVVHLAVAVPVAEPARLELVEERPATPTTGPVPLAALDSGDERLAIPAMVAENPMVGAAPASDILPLAVADERPPTPTALDTPPRVQSPAHATPETPPATPRRPSSPAELPAPGTPASPSPTPPAAPASIPATPAESASSAAATHSTSTFSLSELGSWAADSSAVGSTDALTAAVSTSDTAVLEAAATSAQHPGMALALEDKERRQLEVHGQPGGYAPEVSIVRHWAVGRIALQRSAAAPRQRVDADQTGAEEDVQQGVVARGGEVENAGTGMVVKRAS